MQKMLFMDEETKAHTGPKSHKWGWQRQGMTHVSLVAKPLLVTLQFPRILSFLKLSLWSEAVTEFAWGSHPVWLPVARIL